MARPWSRKRTEPDGGTGEEGIAQDGVRLDDDDHAWWAQTDVAQAWAPPADQPVAAEADDQDLLAEHFGDDWRTSFGYTPPSEEERSAEAAREQQAISDADPYEVLQVDQAATWDEIVAAHRRQARAHHPDLLVGEPEVARARGEDRIRVINAAYQELRVRRGVS